MLQAFTGTQTDSKGTWSSSPCVFYLKSRSNKPQTVESSPWWFQNLTVCFLISTESTDSLLHGFQEQGQCHSCLQLLRSSLSTIYKFYISCKNLRVKVLCVPNSIEGQNLSHLTCQLLQAQVVNKVEQSKNLLGTTVCKRIICHLCFCTRDDFSRLRR